MVEVVRSAGGLVPRALIGGSFSPQGSAITIEVGSIGDLTVGSPRRCKSSFSHPLVTGLPEEFAQAALDGLVRLMASLALPPGVLRIHAAGYAEVTHRRWHLSVQAAHSGGSFKRCTRPMGCNLGIWPG
jgi:hypothetical protein